MKKISTIKKIAIRIGPGGDEALASLPQIIQLPKAIFVEPGLTVHQLPGGTTLELYGAGSHFPNYLFNGGNVVISYSISHIRKVVGFLQQKGASLLGEIEKISPNTEFCYLKLSSGTVIGLYQEH